MENWCGGEETVGTGRHARRLEARALSVRALPDWIKRSRTGTQLRDRSWWVNRAIPNLQSIAKQPGPWVRTAVN